MNRALHSLSLLVAVVLALSFEGLVATSASAQVPTGTPPFGSFSGGPDIINLANLNSHITIPALHKPGRGMPFTYDLSYDTSVWFQVAAGSTISWQPVTNWGWHGVSPNYGGYITYATLPGIPCYANNTYATMWQSFTYYDSLGVSHGFGNLQVWNEPCGPSNGSATATDGSGYSISVSAFQGASSPTVTLSPREGGTISPPVNTPSGASVITDRNGNQISVSSSGIFTDTLGTTALTLSGSGTPTSSLVFTYTSPSGTSTAYTMKYTTYTVQTKFNCSSISEYGPTSNNLVSEIDLPDGSKYSFAYEPTPGVAGNVTGRLASVTLPTGGTISYAYSGGGTGVNGITCADGSAATLARTTPDGTWTYAQVKGTGVASTSTVTDPVGNQSVIQFQGIYETQRQVYQGSSTVGTLLETTSTCYNGSTSPCTGTVVFLPVARRTQIIQLPDSTGKQCKHDSFYNSFGLITEVNDYDYGASGAGVGSLIRRALTSYAPLGNGIVDRPASIIVQDGGTNTKSQTTFAYDETAVTATAWTPQLAVVAGSRGNATTVTMYKDATNIMGSSTATYFDTGNVQTATDVNGTATTYTYGTPTTTCGQAFPNGVSEPLGMSRSMSWNCTGGVQTSVTDENNQTTSYVYNDPYFWRINVVTDPLGNQKGYYYQPNPTWASPFEVAWSLTFNNGNSQASDIQYKDGLGRTYVDQRKQSPNSATLDSVSYTYDTNGRLNSVSMPCATGYAGTCATPKTTRTYDALNRVLTIIDGGGGTTTYSYSQNDVLVTVGPAPIGENTKRRQLEYDALGRLTSVCEITSATGSGPCGQTVSQTGYWTKYAYDVLGNLLTVTQNAQAASGSQQSRSYTYDFLSRLTSENNPETGTTTYTYDTDLTCGTFFGDVVKRVDAAGNTSCFVYDALHRMTSVTYSGPYAASTPNKYFVYDTATVNLVAMANGQTQLVEAYTATTQTGTKITDAGFSYSARGEVADVYQSTPHSSGYYHVKQTYWPHGAPSQLSSNITGLPTISYGGTIGATVGLDGEGRITQVTAASGQNPVTGVTFNNSSLPTQVTFGSADTDIFAYDPNTMRMTQYQFNINGQSSTGALTWNANSSLQKLIVIDAFNSVDNQTCNYNHDDLSRIAQADCGAGGWGQSFSYDPFGNITKNVLTNHTGNSFQPTYNSATNRFSGIPGATVSYDANGNVLTDGSHTYSWDADGNSVSLDGVGLTFDALDRMVEQNRSGTYTEIVYSPGGAKLALMNGAGGQTLQKAFVPLPGQATAVYTSSGLDHYRHSDWLGSARLTTSPTRTVLSTAAYAPFGETYAQTGTADLSFTGQNSDSSAGDYDFLFREYSTQGRWPSPDPGGLASAHPEDPRSWNRYAYVRNNPLSLVDPFGLDCIYDNEDGTVTIVRGDCISDTDNGVFVDGTIDTNSPITYNPVTGDLTFGLTNDAGAYGVGVALGFYDVNAPSDIPLNPMAIEIGQALAPLNRASDVAGCTIATTILGEGRIPPPATHLASEAVAHGLENPNTATLAARAYYTATDARFTAGGKFSKVLVPRLANFLHPVLATAGKAVSVAGWVYTGYEVAKAGKKCAKEINY